VSQEVTGGRWDNFVRRIGNLHGGGSKLSDVVPSAMPVLQLEDLSPELKILQDQRSFGGGLSLTGDAAVPANIGLIAPATDQTIVIVNRVIVTVNTAGNINWFYQDPGTSTVQAPEVATDTRIRDSGAAATVGSRLAALPVTIRGLWRAGGTNPTILDGPWVLQNSVGLFFAPESLTGELIVTFFWTERQLEPSEVGPF